MNQDSFYRLLSTMSITLLPSHLICTYIFLRPLMHNPNSVYYLSKVPCRFPLLHAQFSSTWVIINMETLLPPSKPLFSWLHLLSYVSFLCPFKSTSAKSFLCCLKILFPPFSLGFTPIKCIILSLYWICLSRSQMTTMLLNLTVNSQSQP